MSMFVWPDGTVTGSVNVEELEAIQKAMKGVGKKRLASLKAPVQSAAHLAELLAGTADEVEPEPEPEPPKAVKAAAKKEST